jgi:hypothetical protein
MAGPFKLPNKAEAEAEKKKRVRTFAPTPRARVAPRAPRVRFFFVLPRFGPADSTDH